jgi:thiamine kinase-like enzyme
VQQYDEVLDRLECLRGRPREVVELAGGLTNINLKVTCDDQVVVVRVAQPGNELLAIDRDHEHRNSVAAAEAGVGAPVVEYLPGAGLMVVGYLRGRPFTDDDLRSGSHLPRVAAACRQLHQGPRFVNDFDMFEVQRGYLEVVDRHGFRLPDRYRELLPRVDELRRAFAVRPEPTVPCNNDLLAGNFIDDGTKLWLIDYEYSGNNEATFELGNVWSEAGLTVDQLEELMEAYDGAVLRHRVARARLWGLMSKYGWTLWASIQDAVSTFDFDFWAWGMEKYERALAEFDGPDYERLLVDVTRDD